MKIRFLPFVVTGLITGSLIWWFNQLIYYVPEAPQLDASLYPGIIIAIALLVLGKLLGMKNEWDTAGAVMLLVSTILAQYLVLLYHLHGSGLVQFELGLYPPLYIGGNILLQEVFPNCWMLQILQKSYQ